MNRLQAAILGTVGISTSLFAQGGLSAQYYKNESFLGVPSVSRIDPQINFTAKDDASFWDPVRNYSAASVRWKGYVVPKYTEQYLFTIRRNAYLTLWIDGKLVAVNWTRHSYAFEIAGTAMLESGKKHEIVMEYSTYNTDGSGCGLYWQSASQPRELIPSSALYPYASTSNSRPFARVIWPFNHERVVTNEDYYSGHMVVTNASDFDGTIKEVTLFENDQVIGAQTTPKTWSENGEGRFYGYVWYRKGRPAGSYTYYVKATDNDGNTVVSSKVTQTIGPRQPTPAGHGLLDQNGVADGPLDYWGLQKGIWKGSIVPGFSEPYEFLVFGDGKSKVTSSGQTVVDDMIQNGWVSVHQSHGGYLKGGATFRSLTAGKPYPVQVEYDNVWGAAFFKFMWRSRSQEWEVVPAEAMIPSTSTAALAPTRASVYRSANRCVTCDPNRGLSVKHSFGGRTAIHNIRGQRIQNRR